MQSLVLCFKIDRCIVQFGNIHLQSFPAFLFLCLLPIQCLFHLIQLLLFRVQLIRLLLQLICPLLHLLFQLFLQVNDLRFFTFKLTAELSIVVLTLLQLCLDFLRPRLQFPKVIFAFLTSCHQLIMFSVQLIVPADEIIELIEVVF